jgi:hypothetical protein
MKWFSRLFSVTVISITGSNITCKKGKITRGLIGDLQDILSDLSISRGEIWINGAEKSLFLLKSPPSATNACATSSLAFILLPKLLSFHFAQKH